MVSIWLRSIWILDVIRSPIGNMVHVLGAGSQKLVERLGCYRLPSDRDGFSDRTKTGESVAKTILEVCIDFKGAAPLKFFDLGSDNISTGVVDALEFLVAFSIPISPARKKNIGSLELDRRKVNNFLCQNLDPKILISLKTKEGAFELVRLW